MNCINFFFVKCHSQVYEIELGFKKNEIQHMVTVVPKMLTANKRKLTQIFDYIHNTMKVPHHLIAKFPQVPLYFGCFWIFFNWQSVWAYYVFVYISNYFIYSILPQVLNSKFLRIRERHMFLEYLRKAQYDPALPNYISLDRLATLPDETFCADVASVTVEDFYLFLKMI